MTATQVLNPATYEAGDPERNGLPHELYAQLRAESPCVKAELDDPQLEPYAWIITRHADVQAGARDHRRLSNTAGATLRLFDPVVVSRGGKPAMMAMDAPDHVRNRRIVSRGFTPTVIRAFEARLREIVSELVNTILDKRHVDWVDDLAVALPLQAACELIGVPPEHQADMLKWTNTFAYPADPSYSVSFEEVFGAVTAMWEYAIELAALRRTDPKTDLMSKVAAAFEEEQLSEDEVQGMLLLLAVGGNETTRNALTHGLHALLRYPDQMKLLRDDVEAHLETAVEEILRWSSPIIYVRRHAMEQIELHGQTIEAGDPVALILAAANFDPEVFDEPERFDITRTPNPQLTFSTGPHVCLGQAVARLEIKTLLRELLSRTTDIQQTGDIKYAKDSFTRGVRSFPVQLTPA